MQAQRPLIVSGTSLASEAVLQAAAHVAWALRAVGHRADLSYAVPECNSLGMGLVGGCSASTACDEMRQRRVDTLVILENDLYRRADAAVINEMLSAVKHVIVIDHIMHDTAARADIVLPAATFAEGDGTLVNSEGRAQRFYQVFVPTGDVQESWRWLRDLMIQAGQVEATHWTALDDITAEIATTLPVFASLPAVSASARFRIAGEKIARQPHRYSGRTAMHANVNVDEPMTPADPDSPLSFSMEGYQGQPPSSLLPRYWSPGWNSVQALNKFQEEVGGSMRGGDPGQRLIEPVDGSTRPYFDNIPAPFSARPDQWLVVPLYHVFGSEELSVLSPGVAELSPRPYVALHPDDAQRIGVAEGALLELSGENTLDRLRVKLDATLVPGMAGVPAGLPKVAAISLPGWFTLQKVSTS